MLDALLTRNTFQVFHQSPTLTGVESVLAALIRHSHMQESPDKAVYGVKIYTNKLVGLLLNDTLMSGIRSNRTAQKLSRSAGHGS